MRIYEKEPRGSFCAPGAGRMGLTDRIGALASPRRLVIFPGCDLQNVSPGHVWWPEEGTVTAGMNPAYKPRESWSSGK
jgi:hypothetical protein